jgi:hypothetical protein
MDTESHSLSGGKAMGLILLTAAGAFLVYLAWTLVPPKDVIGSRLPNFDDPNRRRTMIKNEDDQDYDLFLGI